MSGLTPKEQLEYARTASKIGTERADEFTANLEKERGNLH